MTESTMFKGDQANRLRKVVSVKAPREVAWRVFTEKMSTWWPLATHKIGKARAVEAVIEPHVGAAGMSGVTMEARVTGAVCSAGNRARIVLSWEISAHWQHDPNLKTEVEVRFIEEGPDSTRVELEHRHLDRYGARRDQMRGIFDSERGWSGLLEAFARAASR
jgi:uncharacterized protein YndB with AHSA1/START domain